MYAKVLRNENNVPYTVDDMVIGMCSAKHLHKYSRDSVDMDNGSGAVMVPCPTCTILASKEGIDKFACKVKYVVENLTGFSFVLSTKLPESDDDDFSTSWTANDFELRANVVSSSRARPVIWECGVPLKKNIGTSIALIIECRNGIGETKYKNGRVIIYYKRSEKKIYEELERKIPAAFLLKKDKRLPKIKRAPLPKRDLANPAMRLENCILGDPDGEGLQIIRQ